MDELLFELTDEPISVEQVAEKVKRAEAGAVTTFIGTVREWTHGKRTVKLKYEAYPGMAEKKLAEIAEEAKEKWPDTMTAVTHRIGTLHISEIAVVIAVSSPHRRAAFETNEYIIERIKEIVPIWKKEYWEDGTAWVGDQQEKIPYPKGEPEYHD